MEAKGLLLNLQRLPISSKYFMSAFTTKRAARHAPAS
jgi:hypothetical protein